MMDLDLREKGAPRDGQPQFFDNRLFMQLQVFSHCRDARSLAEALAKAGVEGALYEGIHDPCSVAVLALSENPDFFVTKLRSLFNKQPFAELTLKPELTLLGRTYALGYEPDLENWLLRKPRRAVLDPDWPWAVWYPLRRSGEYYRLSPLEQGRILKEHGAIGRAFGSSDLTRDVRLSCHGLDRNDNDFVIGIIGKELYPLSALVAAMRNSEHTASYISQMGPFFVGKAVWQSSL